MQAPGFSCRWAQSHGYLVLLIRVPVPEDAPRSNTTPQLRPKTRIFAYANEKPGTRVAVSNPQTSEMGVRTMRKTLLGLGLAISLCVSANASLTIDNFTTGAYSVSLITGVNSSLQSGSMLGGFRRTILQVLSNPLNRPVVLDIGSGLSVLDNGSLAQSQLTLIYLIGTTTVDLSGYDRLRLHFVGNDLPMNMQVAFYSPTGQAMGTSAVAPGVSFQHDILFSSLTTFGTMDWSQVNYISVRFEPSPSGDFALGQLEIVPEPASLIALATGIVSLVSYARRRK